MRALAVLVVIGCPQGRSAGSADGLLAEGIRLCGGSGGRLGAILLGPGAREFSSALRGPEVAFLGEDPRIDGPSWEARDAALAQAIGEFRPDLVLLGADASDLEAAPLAAHHLGAALICGAQAIEPSEGSLTIRTPLSTGMAVMTCRVALPAVVSLLGEAPRRSPALEGEAPRIIRLSDGPPHSHSARVVEILPGHGPPKGPHLQDPDIIVAGGRGLGGPENFHLIEDLARALGGVPGASRVVCDAQWRPRTLQVGLTGRAVRPKLYIAIGISGAPQHLAGIADAGCIVAIDRDPWAPIFAHADYGIVGDLFEVVPALIRRLSAYS